MPRDAVPRAGSERLLALRWEQSPLLGTMQRTDGRTVRVRYPGRRNARAGPDYLDALLETEVGLLRGAVELHCRSSDWWRHGHTGDAAYAGVVLHVVGCDDGHRAIQIDGLPVPLLVLPPLPARGLAALPAGVPYPCREAQTTDSLLRRLHEAGLERFEWRSASLARSVAAGAGIDQLAYEAIAAALGYEHNSAPLARLARALPLDAVRQLAGGRPARAEALLIGRAGLAASCLREPGDQGGGPAEREWSNLAQAAVMAPGVWVQSGGRPENAPVRRVAALAHIALQWPGGGIAAALRQALTRSPRRATAELARLVMIGRPRSGALNQTHRGVRRHAFRLPDDRSPSHGTSRDGVGLVGHGRAADVVVNVLLPLAAALGAVAGDQALVERARLTYAAHAPPADNWITRLVAERTGLQRRQPWRTADQAAICWTAPHHQGMHEIFDVACRTLACERCPLGCGSNPFVAPAVPAARHPA